MHTNGAPVKDARDLEAVTVPFAWRHAEANGQVILVVDDDRRYRNLLTMNLVRAGYRVTTAVDGLDALNSWERDRPALIILDVMLPELDGYETCRILREATSVPIIMLTARAEQASRVRGLRLGADDYVIKPFGAEELLARVEAVLRRSVRADMSFSAPLLAGDLTIDFAQRMVTVGGVPAPLTRTEYKLLCHLAEHRGGVVTQAELLHHVWGSGFEDQPELLHTTVQRLRRKLHDNPNAPRYIFTRRSIGYSFAFGCESEILPHSA